MGNSRQEKKARILAQQKRRQIIRMAITGIVAVAIVSVGVVLFARSSQGNSQPQSSLINAPSFGGGSSTANDSGRSAAGRVTNVSAKDGVLTFNTEDFADGKAAFFSTEAAGKSVQFFVLKSSDGVIRSAFDACDVCFPAKKGYRQSGDLMVCNNCGQQFHSVRINEEKGGCNPSPLHRHEENGILTIALTDIAQGAMYF